jgi:hypothetical protein
LLFDLCGGGDACSGVSRHGGGGRWAKLHARLLASNLANERRWAAALIQRHFRRRRQARAVLSLCIAASARAREEEAAYRFAIAAAKQQQEDAVTVVETRRKADLERAKGAILGLADEVAEKRSFLSYSPGPACSLLPAIACISLVQPFNPLCA